MIEKIVIEDYGSSPTRPKRKSCMNCAYLQEQLTPGEEEGSQPKRLWWGEKAKCFLGVWERSFGGGLDYFLNDILIYQLYSDDDQLPRLKEIRLALEKNYGLTRIPVTNDGWLELSRWSCKDFYPKHKRGPRTLEKCREEQQKAAQERKDRNRFCISTAIGVVTALAVVITAIITWSTS